MCILTDAEVDKVLDELGDKVLDQLTSRPLEG